jgi:hypothetical protein
MANKLNNESKGRGGRAALRGKQHSQCGTCYRFHRDTIMRLGVRMPEAAMRWTQNSEISDFI